MRLLIVEDDGGSRTILEEHVGARGWTTCCAASPVQAEQLLSGREVDLVLSDIHLPGSSGTDHIRRFCERGLPVVVMTGFPSLETCLDSMRHGAAGYLVKPFKVAEFIAIAERVLAERRRLGDLEARIRQLEAELARRPLDFPTTGTGHEPEMEKR
ncbi:MAG: response regulator [bacterium]|jgi:DNA-binding NtrC family response regulator|nr:response regulator [bacterium]